MEARRDKGDAIGDTSRLQAVELGPTAETPVESTGPCLLYTSDAADDWLVV